MITLETKPILCVIEKKKGAMPENTSSCGIFDSPFDVINLLMLPVGPELQELILIAPRERGEWLRSNRFYVKGITVI